MSNSPCLRLCQVSAGICTGCRRTLAEIQGWRGMSPDEREAVWGRLAAVALTSLGDARGHRD